MTLIIKNGTLVTASETFQADILVEGEKISRVGQNMTLPADAEVVDAGGKLVMPGGVDVHTHFDLPMFNTVSADDHYTGHKAAAFGGTTTVIDLLHRTSIHSRPALMPGMPRRMRRPPSILASI